MVCDVDLSHVPSGGSEAPDSGCGEAVLYRLVYIEAPSRASCHDFNALCYHRSRRRESGRSKEIGAQTVKLVKSLRYLRSVPIG